MENIKCDDAMEDAMKKAKEYMNKDYWDREAAILTLELVRDDLRSMVSKDETKIDMTGTPIDFINALDIAIKSMKNCNRSIFRAWFEDKDCWGEEDQNG